MKMIGLFGIIMGFILISLGVYTLTKKEIPLGVYFNVWGALVFILGIIDYMVSIT